MVEESQAEVLACKLLKVVVQALLLVLLGLEKKMNSK